MENNYIAEQVAKLNAFVQEGHTGPEIVPLLRNIEYLVMKAEETKNKLNDPNRLQEFGDPDPMDKYKNNNQSELKPFGDEEPSSKGFGGK